jgi:capsular polysaccharide biosynthesis protein
MKIDYEIKSLSTHCENMGIPVKYFYQNAPASKFRKIPKTVDIDIHWMYKKYLCNIGQYQAEDSYIANLKNIKIFGYNNLGTIKLVTDKNELISSESTNYKQNENREFETSPPIKGTSVVLASDSSSIYFHWMLQVLPRIKLLNEYKIDWSNIKKIILPEKLGAKFHTQALNYFKIPKEKILRIKPNSVVECENLIIPSIPVKNIFFSKWVYDFLKENFLKKEKKHHEKIYISRKKASGRKVSNEGEVFKFLKNKGFNKICIEDYDIFTQADIFNSAKEIVCPHGSCLANLTFCEPKTKTLELFSPNYVTPLYWSMSNDLDLDYSYLIGEGNRPPEGEDPHLGKENITIDIKELERLI